MPGVERDAPVTDRHAEDDRLKETFQALGETSQRELSQAELDLVWRAVSGELPAEERRDLVDRMARDAALAEAWRSAQELSRAAAAEARSEGRVPRWGASWTSRASWLAAAAVLIAGIGIAIVYQRSGLRDETFRDPGHYVIESLVQPDVTLPRDAFRLRWTPGPPDTRYQVTVTTEDLMVLASVPSLTLPELTLEGRLLSNVAPGARVLWQVTAALPGGESVSSQTFVVRVQ
jgi:hypothetical protein